MNGENNLMSFDEYQNFRKQTPVQSIVANLTDDCNLRCTYCFTHHRPRKMSLQVAKDGIKFLIKEQLRTGKNYPKSFAFFGGEPMLMYDTIIVPLLLWAEEENLRERYKLSFNMTTNGTLFTTERLAFLKDKKVSILLSCDGDKFTQDIQRPFINGKGSFKAVDDQIRNFLRFNPGSTCRATCQPENASRVFENYLYARKVGFDGFFVCPNSRIEWSLTDIERYLRELALVFYQFYSDVCAGENYCIPQNLIARVQNCFLYNTPESDNFQQEYLTSLLRCGIGTVGIGLGCEGEISGCQERSTYEEDDIFKIGDIYNGIDESKHLKLINTYLGQEKKMTCRNNPNFCKHCAYKNICGVGYCPSSNLALNGDLLANSMVQCYENDFSVKLTALFTEMLEKEPEPVKKRFEQILLYGIGGE